MYTENGRNTQAGQAGAPLRGVKGVVSALASAGLRADLLLVQNRHDDAIAEVQREEGAEVLLFGLREARGAATHVK